VIVNLPTEGEHFKATGAALAGLIHRKKMLQQLHHYSYNNKSIMNKTSYRLLHSVETSIYFCHKLVPGVLMLILEEDTGHLFEGGRGGGGGRSFYFFQNSAVHFFFFFCPSDRFKKKKLC